MYEKMTPNLMVKCVDKAIAFYKEVLGFSVVTSVQGKSSALQFAILIKDEQMLMLQEMSNFIEEYPVLSTEKIRPSVSLYILTDNVEKLYHEIKSKYPINTDLHTSFYGAKEFAVTDIDGYVLTFAEQKG
jgi:uncharacterized glyoxalase superfamily protein PhnB